MEINSVKTSEATVNYMKFGSGTKPFVIIPGLSIKSVLLSANAVENAYSVFGEEYTVYLFDRREELSKGVTVFDFVRDTAEAMTALGISNADVFGTSQGGMIAMALAIEYPELVSHLALGSSAARVHVCSKPVIDKWIELAHSSRAEELCRDFINKVYSKPFAEKYGAMLVQLLSDCTQKELDSFALCARACDGFDITSELKGIKCPLLVLGAENDAVLSGEASKEIADILGCEIYMYGEPYGHAVYDEAPDYRDRLLDFYRR